MVSACTETEAEEEEEDEEEEGTCDGVVGGERREKFEGISVVIISLFALLVSPSLMLSIKVFEAMSASSSSAWS